MKVVILAGGYGTRIGEETHLRPKPMIEIGERPMLWHIMKIYSHYGFNEFVVCLGFKGYIIKEYFANYFLHESDVTFHFGLENKVEVHSHTSESWIVTLVNTGVDTMTGGRIKRIRDYIGEKTFMMTYGDGLADINIPELLRFHRGHGKCATVTGVQPAGRFGSLQLGENSQVVGFKEKPKEGGIWVNGGFFVLEPDVFDYIPEGYDSCVFEEQPMETLATENQLFVHKHNGFWQPMDTMRDKRLLEKLWQDGKAPWRRW